VHRQIRHQLAGQHRRGLSRSGAGLDGLYTNGTAGEFHCLDEAEYDLITDVVAQACQRAGVPCQLGASHMSGQISLRRIRVAAADDPAAIQVILPDWCALVGR
jgi:dihydrodipicolinate synthase/N-acetylneuraminate lyase